IDQEIQEMVLDSWQDISYVNLSAHIFTINSTNGVFLVRIFAVEGYTDVNGTIIAPAEIKIDFEFHNFPFINETSLLALQTKFQTNAVFKLKEETRGEDEGYAEKEDSVELESGSAVGYFAWAENASADGVEIEVLTSPMKLGASEKFMYLNYPHATHIVHDPKIGFVSEISAFYISGFPLVTVFSVIGIASLVLIIRKRKLN
ncbi:MAG: Loki-CTERM sorting domain-containing protein, partial [Promethearchaeota archaeon]